MGNIIIAIAQTNPAKGDIEANIQDHAIYIKMAAEQKADVIVFPELSLTSYEPELASELAVTVNYKGFDILRDLSNRHDIAIIAGAPIKNADQKPHIGSLLFNSGIINIYRKQHLHPGEEKFFSCGSENGTLTVKGVNVGLAICADISKEIHAHEAASNGAMIYAASVFITPRGYANDAALLQHYALQYRMAIIMSNYCGTSGGIESAGRSAVWDESGQLIFESDGLSRELIIAEKYRKKWKGRIIAL